MIKYHAGSCMWDPGIQIGSLAIFSCFMKLNEPCTARHLRGIDQRQTATRMWAFPHFPRRFCIWRSSALTSLSMSKAIFRQSWKTALPLPLPPDQSIKEHSRTRHNLKCCNICDLNLFIWIHMVSYFRLRVNRHGHKIRKKDRPIIC